MSKRRTKPVQEEQKNIMHPTKKNKRNAKSNEIVTKFAQENTNILKQ